MSVQCKKEIRMNINPVKEFYVAVDIACASNGRPS